MGHAGFGKRESIGLGETQVGGFSFLREKKRGGGEEKGKMRELVGGNVWGGRKGKWGKSNSERGVLGIRDWKGMAEGEKSKTQKSLNS